MTRFPKLLESLRPDLIIADEAHRLKSKKAGVTRRVLRYMKNNPDVPVCIMSGTVMKKSLNDFAHIAKMTHKENSPMPLHEGDLIAWANALDEGVNPIRRTDPGPLVDWCPASESTTKEIYVDELTRARRGFYHRFSSTPGVVCTSTENVSCSIYVNAIEYQTNAATEMNFEMLRTLWCTPDEHSFAEAAVAWMYARELALGLHYFWDPPAPKDWRDARKKWHQFVRGTLSDSRTLDTELQVANAIDKGLVLDDGILAAWRKIRPTFDINPDFRWHDDAALDVCVEWAKRPGIIWIEHTFFGKELSRRTGLPYFGPKGLDANGRYLQTYSDAIRDSKEKPACILASVAACHYGYNLQPWNRNLITACPAGAALWEQLLGRTHRTGQLADEIEVDVLMGALEHYDAWTKAVAQAAATTELLKQPQKLGIADVIKMPSFLDITARSDYRWKKAIKLVTQE